MIALNITALAKAMKKIRDGQTKLKEDASAAYRQKLRALLEIAAHVSPQWSGDYASNWAFAIDGDMPVYRMWQEKHTPGMTPVEGENGKVTYRAHQAGDLEAIGTAVARGTGQLKSVTYKSQVHLVNMTPLEMTGTHMVGPDGTVKLRPVNMLTGGERIESYIRARAKEASKL